MHTHRHVITMKEEEAMHLKTSKEGYVGGFGGGKGRENDVIL